MPKRKNQKFPVGIQQRAKKARRETEERLQADPGSAGKKKIQIQSAKKKHVEVTPCCPAMQNERTDVQTSLAQAKAELTTLEANETSSIHRKACTLHYRTTP